MGKKTKQLEQEREERFQNEMAPLAGKSTARAPRVILAHSHLTSVMSAYSLDWIRRPEDWVLRIKSRNEKRVEQNLIRHLFAQYKVPEFLENNFINSRIHNRLIDNKREINFNNWYITVAQGRSLFKKCTKGILTKRETNMFLKAPKNFTCTQALWWARAICIGDDQGHAHRLAHTQLAYREVKDAFWLSVLHFFINNPTTKEETNDLIDYLSSERGENEDFSMAGRTLASVRRNSEIWHRQVINKEVLSKYTWAGVEVSNWKRQYVYQKTKHINWTVTQIITGNDLAAEGRNQHHCVAFYRDRCIKGEMSIWSMKSECLGIVKRRLTISLDKSGRIIEARGFANRSPRKDERQILVAWHKDFHNENVRRDTARIAV